MSQTVKIDAAAQDAIVEIVGTPWEKDYYDNTNDDERDYTALITREGTSIRVLVSGEGYPAYMWHYEAEQIANSILRAAKDAKAFQKAQSEWARSQMQRLNCEIDGGQNMWGYGFYVNGRHYEVNFTTNEKARTCIILNQAAKPIFQKVTDDVRKVSQEDAALVLKTFLLSKRTRNDSRNEKGNSKANRLHDGHNARSDSQSRSGVRWTVAHGSNRRSGNAWRLLSPPRPCQGKDRANAISD